MCLDLRILLGKFYKGLVCSYRQYINQEVEDGNMSKTDNADVVVQLKEHEEGLFKKVEDYKDKSGEERDKIVRNADNKVKKEDEKLQKERERELNKTKDKAKQDAKKIVNDYEKRKKKIDGLYRSNSKKAVNKVVTALFEKK